MPPETLSAFALFALVTSITPGPNNLMLLASGINFGFRPSVPHMLGISIGFFFMALAVGLGLAEVIAQLPGLYGVLKWVGAAYMLYLAWCIAQAGPPDDAGDAATASRSTRPLGFWGAAAFQWVNPKAWVMAVSAFSTYVPATSNTATLALAALIFAAINLPCVSVWVLFGVRLRAWLQHPRKRQWFNYALAALLVASLYPLLLESA